MAGDSGVKAGDAVWANNGGEDWIGFVQHPEQDVGGELKARIQHPDGTSSQFGYREPEDRDDQGSGGTFWLV